MNTPSFLDNYKADRNLFFCRLNPTKDDSFAPPSIDGKKPKIKHVPYPLLEDTDAWTYRIVRKFFVKLAVISYICLLGWFIIATLCDYKINLQNSYTYVYALLWVGCSILLGWLLANKLNKVFDIISNKHIYKVYLKYRDNPEKEHILNRYYPSNTEYQKHRTERQKRELYNNKSAIYGHGTIMRVNSIELLKQYNTKD